MNSTPWLDEELKACSLSDLYPFHMPGHKRQHHEPSPVSEAEQIDITEIEGFDNLHQSEGILLAAQERMASLFQAAQSFFLVNGSTSGILTAVHAATRTGDRFLIARNCHRSVWHAAMLRRVRCDTISPMETESGIQGSIDPQQLHDLLERAARENDPYSAVLITSPTYDGVLSDIAAIASCAHAFGIPLIVDEAHGAHLGFYPGTQKAISCGGDYVIESLHKTLPALTQTAVLHLADSPYVSGDRVRRYLAVFQTSSPSYVLMASMDRCTRILTERGAALFRDYDLRLQDFYRFAKSLKRVAVLSPGKGPGIYDREPSKILIRVLPADPFAENDRSKQELQNGAYLLHWFRETHHLVMEMAAGPYVTALTSVMDTDEGFSRLKDALSDLDRLAGARSSSGAFPPPKPESRSAGSDTVSLSGLAAHRPALSCRTHPTDRRAVLEIYEAVEQESHLLPLSESAGAVSAEFVGLYPPGIPLLVPGERITADVVSRLCAAIDAGTTVTGLESAEDGTLMLRTLCI